MKKCLVYGNCQSMAIRDFLSKHPDFRSFYDLLDIKPVHLLTQDDIETLEQTIAETDLFIHQPISDNYKGIPQLSTSYLKSQSKASCTIVSFPVAYFTAYNPEITYLKGKNNAAISKPFPYHDLNILKLYAEGKSVEETIEAIESEVFYSTEYLQDNLSTTLANLEAREKSIDILLSPFIRENFREKRLFHTFNHPSSIVLEYLINSILDFLDINREKGRLELFRNHDFLAQNSFPIYPSVAKALDLSFSLISNYRIDKKELARREAVEAFFSFYDHHQDEVPGYIANTVPKT